MDKLIKSKFFTPAITVILLMSACVSLYKLNTIAKSEVVEEPINLIDRLDIGGDEQWADYRENKLKQFLYCELVQLKGVENLTQSELYVLRETARNLWATMEYEESPDIATKLKYMNLGAESGDGQSMVRLAVSHILGINGCLKNNYEGYKWTHLARAFGSEDDAEKMFDLLANDYGSDNDKFSIKGYELAEKWIDTHQYLYK